MILDSLIENLEAEGLLQSAPRTHLLLGYSGGADSTALLFLLNAIKARYPLDVTVAYFNHRWRGMPPAELPLIHRNCLKTQFPLVIIQADLTTPKTENAARHARYRQLTQLAHDVKANAVLTAHHADDQIETLLFRILRGTGLDGLSGIQKRLVLDPAYGKPVPILRPMLDIARKRIREYVDSEHLEYFNDPTNDDLKIQRNNIRNRILPVLESSFPQVKNALFRLSLVAEGDLHILDETISDIWKTVYGADKEGPYLEALPFNQLGLAYQRRILKRFLSQQDIHADFQSIEDLLLFIQGEGRRNLDASLKSLIKSEDGKTRFLSFYKNKLRMIAAPEAEAPREPIAISVPGHVQIPALNLTFTALPWREPEKVMISPIRPNDNQQVFVDLSTFQEKPLELRTRRPGDKFQPIGMDKPLRFKKFLINRGVPRFTRNSLPVLVHENQILWAPGLGISQHLRVKDRVAPTHLLRLQTGLHPEPPLLYSPPPVEEEEKPRPPLDDILEHPLAADDLLSDTDLEPDQDDDENASIHAQRDEVPDSPDQNNPHDIGVDEP